MAPTFESGLHDGADHHDVKDHDEGSDVGRRLACGDVSGGEFEIAQGGKPILVEKWNVCCGVGECDGGENVDGGVENDVESVVENVNVVAFEWVLRSVGSGKEVHHERKKVELAVED